MKTSVQPEQRNRPALNKVVTFRATPDDVSRWTENASCRGLDLSEFIRVAANGARLPPINLEAQQRARLLELVLLLAQQVNEIRHIASRPPSPDTAAVGEMLESWLITAETIVTLLRESELRRRPAQELPGNGTLL